MNLKKQPTSVPLSVIDYEILTGLQKRLKDYDSEILSVIDCEDRSYGIRFGGNKMADKLGMYYPFTIKKDSLDGLVINYKKYPEVEVMKFIMNSNGIEREPRICDEASLKAFNYLRNSPFIGIDQILVAHKFLMAEKNILEKYKGAIRDKTVYIARRECNQSPGLIVEQLTEWLKLMYQYGDTIQGLLLLHAMFEYIHPFIDGNGRIGRLLYLIMAERLTLPFRFFSDKDEYRLLYYNFLGKFDEKIADINRLNFLAYKEVYKKEDKNMLRVVA